MSFVDCGLLFVCSVFVRCCLCVAWSLLVCSVFVDCVLFVVCRARSLTTFCVTRHAAFVDPGLSLI